MSMQTNHRLKRLQYRRKLWLKVHLYLGLTIGTVLLLIALTGSILVFWLEIDRWLNPELTMVDPSDSSKGIKSMHDIVASATAAMPAEAVLSYVYPPHFPEMAYFFFFDVSTSDADKHHTLNVFVNPYTAEVLGTRTYYSATSPLKHCFMGFIFKLHYALLSGTTGSALVGFLGVLSIISTLSGLILWWPLTHNWIKALTIKRHASFERLNFDVHKISGFYFSLILLGVLLSGVSINLPDQFTWIVERFSTVDQTHRFSTHIDLNKPSISVDQAWKIAKQNYPEGNLYWFSIPTSEAGVYVFTIHSPLGAGFHGRQKIIIDRYGQVLHSFNSLSGSGGSIFMQWMWPIHSGQFLGLIGRLLVFLSGMVCMLLYITGCLRWLQKRQAVRNHLNPERWIRRYVRTADKLIGSG